MSINIYKDYKQTLNVEQVFFNSIYTKLSSAKQFYPDF